MALINDFADEQLIFEQIIISMKHYPREGSEIHEEFKICLPF